MAEIAFRELAGWLEDPRRGSAEAPAPDVFLIHGEAWFVREALERLLQALLPEGPRSAALEVFEGAAVPAGEVLAALRTYALLGPGKVVCWRDAPLFPEAGRAASLIEEARRLLAAGERGKARAKLRAALALEGLTAAQALKRMPAAWRPAGAEPGEEGLRALLAEEAEAEPAAPAADAAALLERALAGELPPGNRLVLTCGAVDRRRSLYRTLGRRGVVVDCSVPRGERRAERAAREALLEEVARTRLARSGKTLSPAARAALSGLTGFDPGVYAANLETLIAYVGERAQITAEDVAAVLSRSRTDPLFELTQALGDRDRERALAVLQSLWDAGTHPLALLAGMANLLRRLIVAEDFLSGPGAVLRRRRLDYAAFQKTLWPAVVDYDRGLAAGPGAGNTEAERPESAAGDLRLVRNPGSTYPVFVLLGQALRFSRAELAAGLERAVAAEAALKSSTLAPRRVLEDLAERICGRGGRGG